MDNIYLNSIWDRHGTNLQSELQLNYTTLKNTNFKSARLSLKRLLIRRCLEVLLFLIITTLLINFIIANKEPQYIISGFVLGLFTIIGALGGIWQLVLIIHLDYSKPVTLLLLQMEKLKIYSLQTLRLLILSFPFYFAYIIIGFKVLINFDIYSNADSPWLIWNTILCVLLIPFSIYLYSQLRINAKRNWLKKIIADSRGKQIAAAFNFINEIAAYKKNGGGIAR